jgi:hypothetical protein
LIFGDIKEQKMALTALFCTDNDLQSVKEVKTDFKISLDHQFLIFGEERLFCHNFAALP